MQLSIHAALEALRCLPRNKRAGGRDGTLYGLGERLSLYYFVYASQTPRYVLVQDVRFCIAVFLFALCGGPHVRPALSYQVVVG